MPYLLLSHLYRYSLQLPITIPSGPALVQLVSFYGTLSRTDSAVQDSPVECTSVALGPVPVPSPSWQTHIDKPGKGRRKRGRQGKTERKQDRKKARQKERKKESQKILASPSPPPAQATSRAVPIYRRFIRDRCGLAHTYVQCMHSTLISIPVALSLYNKLSRCVINRAQRER